RARGLRTAGLWRGQDVAGHYRGATARELHNKQAGCVVARGTLVERAVVRVGRGPVQLCSVAGGGALVALAGGDTTLTVLDGQTAAVRSVIEVGSSPRNAIAHGSHVYVAMHTDAPAECLDAVQVVDYGAGTLVSTIRLSTESRPKIVVPAWER